MIREVFMRSEKGKLSSKLFSMLLALALCITMMPFGVTAAFAADASEFQPALTITGPDGTVTEYQTVQDVIDQFKDGEDNESFGVALKGIFVKRLLSGYEDDCVVTVETQDNYTGTLNASGKTVKELKDLKGILAYSEDGKEFDPTSDEVNSKGKPLYGGYFKFYVGKDADGNVLVDKWVNRITISKASGEPEPEPAPAPPILTVIVDGQAEPLVFADMKTLKNDERIKPLTLTGKVFHTMNSYGTEEDFTVNGVTIESLIKLAGVKSGRVIDSVTATAGDGYSKTYTAKQITQKDLKGNKAMYIWEENGAKVQKTAVGQFAKGENNRGAWVNDKEATGITIEAKTKAVTKPAKAVVTLVSGKKKATVKWRKVTGAEGYEIYRSLKKTKGFKKIKTVTSGKTVKFINSKLKGRKAYYYKVRAYKKDANGKKIYGSFSKVKKVTTKR